MSPGARAMHCDLAPSAQQRAEATAACAHDLGAVRATRAQCACDLGVVCVAAYAVCEQCTRPDLVQCIVLCTVQVTVWTLFTDIVHEHCS